MEYAKDKIYPIKYKDIIIKKNKSNSIIRLLICLGGIFSLANIIAIYNFFRILSNM